MMLLVKAIFVLGLAALSTSQISPQNELCVTDAYPPPPNHTIPWFTINLDLPGKERWTEVITNKTAEIRHLLAEFKKFIGQLGKAGKFIIKLIDDNGGKLAKSFPAPYGDELTSISNITGLPLGEVVLYNVFYEVFSVCTSIIAQDPTGRLYHARNLDFGLFMGWDEKNRTWAITEALRPTIVNLDFQSGGKTVFKAANFAGYIGIFSGIKPQKFTMTLNERYTIDGGYVGILEWLLGDHSGNWVGFLTRHVLETATSFAQAKDLLTNSKLLAPAYFIIGGTEPHQGCVITRDRIAKSTPTEVWCMNDTMWYILETNYDHWKAPPFFDNRRTPAIHCMEKMSAKNVTVSGIYNVLSSKPVLNKLTTYTTVMQVATGAMETYLQYCPDPCFPW